MSALPHKVYGDWEWDEVADKPGALYPALVESRWPGGVEFATDRATVERIVESQQALRADALFAADVDNLELEGGTLVLTDIEGTKFEYTPSPDGLYHGLGFGWVWQEEEK